jgi:hypothetical protein
MHKHLNACHTDYHLIEAYYHLVSTCRKHSMIYGSFNTVNRSLGSFALVPKERGEREIYGKGRDGGLTSPGSAT